MKVRELTKWDELITTVTRDGVEAEEVITYWWMDWMYAKFYDMKWEILNAVGEVEKWEDWFYRFIDWND
jgi:hypothetical protein